jgi:hypothetical protein
MLRVLQVAVSLDSDTSMGSWFKTAGYSRGLWYAWKKLPGFIEWWDEATRQAFKDYEQEWVKIGLKRMQKSNREAYYYWKEVGEKIYKYMSGVLVKTDKSPEEVALTEEILKMVSHENKLRFAKEISTKVVDVTEIEESPSDNTSEDNMLEVLEQEFKIPVEGDDSK